MRPRRSAAVLVGAAVAAVALSAPAFADHVSISIEVSGKLAKLTPTSALVEMSWAMSCPGAGSASYDGFLWLVDQGTGEEIPNGGVFGATGTATQPVERKDHERSVAPRLRASCFDNATLHGSGVAIKLGPRIVVPPLEDDDGGGGGGGGGGGQGGGGGGGGSGAEPDDPLTGGGCADERRGTGGPDTIEGSSQGDLVWALGGDDRVSGRDGHDCLVGGSGADRLLGEQGRDRLTGGSGADTLRGGPGSNAYDAGSGEDRISARNDRAETVRCGPGEDRASVDRADRVSGCERVARPGAAATPPGAAPPAPLRDRR